MEMATHYIVDRFGKGFGMKRSEWISTAVYWDTQEEVDRYIEHMKANPGILGPTPTRVREVQF